MQVIQKRIKWIVYLCILMWASAANAQTHMAVAFMDTAQHYIASNDLGMAITWLNKAIQADAYFKPAYYRKAELLAQLERKRDALATWKQVCAFDTNMHPEALFSMGMLAMELEEYKTGINCFREIWDENEVIETNTIYYKKDNQGEGVDGVSTLVSMKSQIANKIGLCYKGIGNYDSALYFFGQAIQLDSGNVQPYLNESATYKLIGDDAKAAAVLGRSLEQHPDNVEVLVENINRCEEAQDYEKMLQLAKSLYEKQGDEPACQYALGKAQYFNGLYQASLENLRKVGLWYARDEQYYEFLGLCQTKLKDNSGAIETFGKGMQLAPDNYKYYFYRANVWYAMEYMDKAGKDYVKSISLGPGHGKSHYNYAMVLLSQKRNNEACNQLEQALRLGMGQAQELIDKYCTGE